MDKTVQVKRLGRETILENFGKTTAKNPRPERGWGTAQGAVPACPVAWDRRGLRQTGASLQPASGGSVSSEGAPSRKPHFLPSHPVTTLVLAYTIPFLNMCFLIETSQQTSGRDTSVVLLYI